MAGFAIYLKVFSFQRVASQVVVEAFLVKMDHVEFTSVVLTMAGKTIFIFHAGIGVKALFLGHQVFNFLMAIQTLLVGNLFANDVAFGTIGHTFQIGMGSS